jgi:pimeloyl-ACP methyl ester carboxylesterase
VATALAEQRPDLVAGIALISSGASLDALRPQPAILKLLRFPPVGRLLWSLQTDTMIRTALLKMTARPVEIPPEAVAEMRGTSYHAFRMVLRHNTEYLAERSAPDRLAALRQPVPVLVVFGGAEPRYEPSSFRQYEKVPNVRIEMLPGVGHVPLLEAPEATGALLLDFAATTAGVAEA